MKFKSILKNHTELEESIENIIRYVQEIIADLPYKEKKTAKEKRMLLEALLIRACALWERFVEKELILSVCLDTNKLIKEIGLPERTKLNTKLIKAILFSDHYRDFHNVERSIGFFKKIIEDTYNPFTSLTRTQKQKLDFNYKMRNYLSHYSDFSKRKLYNDYNRLYDYKKFMEPGNFLLKNNGKHFEGLINNFKLMSVHMRQKFK